MIGEEAMLQANERERLYRECCVAIGAAGRERESLFLARLVLLLIEQVGDAQRCRDAIAQAGTDLPLPSLSRDAAPSDPTLRAPS